MKECTIEDHLVAMVESYGGECVKFSSLGDQDLPDRLCFLPIHKPYGGLLLVEVKKPGESPRESQIKRMRDFARLGFEVCWIKSKIGAAEAIMRDRRPGSRAYWINP